MIYKNYLLFDPILYWILIEMDSEFVPDEVDPITGESLSKSAGGILMTKKVIQQDVNSGAHGTIIAMGDCVWNQYFKEKVASPETKCPLSVGKKVMVQGYSGRNAFPLKGEKKFTIGRFQYVTEQMIMGVL